MGDKDLSDIKNSVHDLRNYAKQINADLDGKILTALKDASTKGIAEKLDAINKTIYEGFAAVVAEIAKLQQPLPPPQPKLFEVTFMYIVKDDNPDVLFSLVLGDVTDAEGNVIPDAALDVTVESDNAAAVAVTFDAAAKTGSVSFGSPGQANVTANVSTGGKLLGTGAAAFTITAGDPAAISSVALKFDGITES